MGKASLVLKCNKLKINIIENKKAIPTCSYYICLYLYWLYLKLDAFCGLASNFIPTNIQNVGILKFWPEELNLNEKDFLSASLISF